MVITEKDIILAHVEIVLEISEWARFRKIAITRKSFAKGLAAAPDATIENLLEEAVTEDSISFNEMLSVCKERFEVKIIGTSDVTPVYFIENQGVYLWPSQPDGKFTHMLWLTHPAYPPNW
jgi:hypothetical protein